MQPIHQEMQQHTQQMQRQIPDMQRRWQAHEMLISIWRLKPQLVQRPGVTGGWFMTIQCPPNRLQWLCRTMSQSSLRVPPCNSGTNSKRSTGRCSLRQVTCRKCIADVCGKIRHCPIHMYHQAPSMESRLPGERIVCAVKQQLQRQEYRLGDALPRGPNPGLTFVWLQHLGLRFLHVCTKPNM